MSLRASSEIQCSGIVVYKEEYLEADLRIVVVTESLGLLSLYIRGIRKSKKRDMAAIDILSYSKFILSVKNEVYQVKDFELIESFENIKNDLFKISSALYLGDAMKRVLHGGEDEKEKKYELLLNSFRYFNREENQSKILLSIAYFLFRIISIEGICFERVEDIISTKDKKNLEERRILGCFLKRKVKVLLGESLEKKSIFTVIELLERYLGEHLEVRLNLKKMIII